MGHQVSVQSGPGGVPLTIRPRGEILADHAAGGQRARRPGPGDQATDEWVAEEPERDGETVQPPLDVT